MTDLNWASIDGRVTALEIAVIGSIDVPGMLEIQRAQNREIEALRHTVDGLSVNVRKMAEARQRELDMREGEAKAVKTFRNIAYAALAFLAAGGATLGSQLLVALKELAK